MSKKISVHVDLMKSEKELDEIIYKCPLDNIAKKAANNYEKQLLQYAIREKAKQVYAVRKTYHGKCLKKWWSDYSNADGCNTIAELKDFEGVGHRMKGGKRHNHVRNVLERKLNKSKSSRKRCHNYLNKGYVYKFFANRCPKVIK